MRSRVGGAAPRVQKVCPVETAEPSPGTQGSSPGAPQFWRSAQARGAAGSLRRPFLLTGNQLRHQTLLGAAGATGRDRGGCGRQSPPDNVISSCGSWVCCLEAHLMLACAPHQRGAHSPGPSGPRPGPARVPGSEPSCHTSVLLTSGTGSAQSLVVCLLLPDPARHPPPHSPPTGGQEQ